MVLVVNRSTKLGHYVAWKSPQSSLAALLRQPTALQSGREASHPQNETRFPGFRVDEFCDANGGDSFLLNVRRGRSALGTKRCKYLDSQS